MRLIKNVCYQIDICNPHSLKSVIYAIGYSIMLFLMLQNREIITATTMGYQSCSSCNGVGKVICTNCNGNGYIIDDVYVGNGTVYVPLTDTMYYFNSSIRYIPCVVCGGSSADENYYPYKKFYYSDNNFTTLIYTSYSVNIEYIEGTGYTSDCTNCKGEGEIAITYQIKYNGNGNTSGSMTNSTCTYDVSQTLRSNQFKRTGYTFIGWATTDGVVTDTGEDVKIAYKQSESVKNLTTEQEKIINLYAIWKRNQYTVTYHANGGILQEDTKTKSFYYGDMVNLDPVCIKDGYIFLGWAKGVNENTCLSSYTIGAENITLYALYSIAVSDVKEAHILCYYATNPDNYNLFELETESETINGYCYTIDGINLLNGLSGEDLNLWLILYDHAGNRNQIPIETPISSEEQEPGDIPIPNSYLQTVEHYLWNMQTESYQYYMSLSELVYEGEEYIPQYISQNSKDYPIGYIPEKIDSAYTVTDVKTVKAYYKPISYMLYFDANGGNCNITSKNVYMGGIYGELPTPSRKGYHFMGWYTKKTDGIKVVDTDIYAINGDSTLYAIWEVNTHNVIYDYKTNGGISVEKETDSVDYGQDIDMTVIAVKDGWKFIGWNTNPNATDKMNTMKMGDEDVILYAIYKKNIKALFVDYKDESVLEREMTVSIYNKEKQGKIVIPEQNTRNGWKNLGWTTSVEANEIVELSSGTEIWLTEDIVLYGNYAKDITISYDTNGSSEKLEEQTKNRYFNASGDYENPKFTIAKAPKLEKHGFVSWIEQDENANIICTYNPQEEVFFEKDTLLTAKWDRWPEIEAYDRYFTLEEAVLGKITKEKLLEKVIATDREDGVLVNGTDVIVKDYNANDFVNIEKEEQVTVFYKATDSFGNYVEKAITVYIVDTTMKISPMLKYVRFISEDFYWNQEELLSKEEGGVETTSVWRINESYRRLLAKTLSNKKKNISTKIIKFLNISADILDIGTGNWEQEKQTWVFSQEDMKKMDMFTDTYGFGNLEIENATEVFKEWFGKCMQ